MYDIYIYELILVYILNSKYKSRNIYSPIILNTCVNTLHYTMYRILINLREIHF